MEAYLYDRLADENVRCLLCNHYCMIKPGNRGICNVRENRNGQLFSLVYDRVIARNIDPIEKKPLFHVYPGSRSFSVATAGCNFSCSFCQNSDIAQLPKDHGGRITGVSIPPQDLVEQALYGGCTSIAYTYTEPTIYFELAYDTATIARQKGLVNIFVTNGYMSTQALDMVSPVLDAANVDLKAFDDSFYTNLCGARRRPVMDTIVRMKKAGIWVEVTTLVIPGRNDDFSQLRDLAFFLVNEAGPETPWHISRFHPDYRLRDSPPTPVDTLLKARDIGLAAGLKYVYTGNIPGRGGESTECPSCKKVVIDRVGYGVDAAGLQKGACRNCGEKIEGIGM